MAETRERPDAERRLPDHVTTPLLTLLMSGPGNAFNVRISPPAA